MNSLKSVNPGDLEINIEEIGATKILITLDFINEPEFAKTIYERLAYNLAENQTLSINITPKAAPPDGSD
jgi:hypothetical protein